MPDSFVESLKLPECPFHEKVKNENKLITFTLEITARCNNNCRHCYLNLPAKDKKAKASELSPSQIKKIIDQAADLGALWCLVTGGEPLLRKDFSDIYLYLKKKGFLVSVFTNATLITEKHIKLFKRYPPRDIEVTVYGITQGTYEKVTRNPGSFNAFMRGLTLLSKNKIEARLKTVALRSNLHEITAISQFCRERTKDYFRFDPFLGFRYDSDIERNKEIKSERLLAEEIITAETNDPKRLHSLQKVCCRLVKPEFARSTCKHLFHCESGKGSFVVSYDGFLRLCGPLWHPDCIYDLKKGKLVEALNKFIPQVRDMRSNNKNFLNKCRVCPIINLCFWCPAHSYLESGKLDEPINYFCELAHARLEMAQKG
jgi:radical SAM protein with 4Fe4S-binding SPASM domain